MTFVSRLLLKVIRPTSAQQLVHVLIKKGTISLSFFGYFISFLLRSKREDD